MNNYKKIPGLSSYFINRSGVVVDGRGRRVKVNVNQQGYMYCSLKSQGKCKSHLIHRLIAQAFIPNPCLRKIVCHKNDIKIDNRIENLYWGTHKTNAEDRVQNDKNKQRVSKQTLERLKAGEASKIMAMNQIKKLRSRGLTVSLISRIVNAKPSTVNSWIRSSEQGRMPKIPKKACHKLIRWSKDAGGINFFVYKTYGITMTVLKSISQGRRKRVVKKCLAIPQDIC